LNTLRDEKGVLEWPSKSQSKRWERRVSGNARVSGEGTILCISNIGTRNSTLTICKTKGGWSVFTGCFTGTVDELESKLTDKHGDYRIFIPAIRAWCAMNGYKGN
jgi:hypothetical protein